MLKIYIISILKTYSKFAQLSQNKLFVDEEYIYYNIYVRLHIYFTVINSHINHINPIIIIIKSTAIQAT